MNTQTDSNVNQQTKSVQSQKNEIELIRQKKARQYYLQQKYGKLLEFDKEKRSLWRIINFLKKKVFISVCNLTDEEIKEINGVYRYRCFLNEFDEADLLSLNEVFDIQMESIKFEPDESIRKIMLDTLIEERRVQMNDLIKSSKTMRYPVMLDLRIYGPNPDMGVTFSDRIFELDDTTKLHIRNTYERINPSSIVGERFIQMLNHSRILRNSYAMSSISQKPLGPNSIPTTSSLTTGKTPQKPNGSFGRCNDNRYEQIKPIQPVQLIPKANEKKTNERKWGANVHGFGNKNNDCNDCDDCNC